MPIQESYSVFLYDTIQERKTSGEAKVLLFSPRERLLRALKYSLICLLVAIFCVFIPVLHFVLTPIFFFATFFIFFYINNTSHIVISGQGTCPECSKNFTVQRMAYSPELKQTCSNCLKTVLIKLPSL